MKQQATAAEAQRDAMLEQSGAMKGQLETMQEQAKLFARQIDLMIQNERAYMGIRRINPIGLDGKADLAVRVPLGTAGKARRSDLGPLLTLKSALSHRNLNGKRSLSRPNVRLLRLPKTEVLFFSALASGTSRASSVVKKVFTLTGKRSIPLWADKA